MNDRHTDISDNEIRIISSRDSSSPVRPRRKRLLWVITAGIIIALSAIAAAVIITSSGDNNDDEIISYEPIAAQSPAPLPTEEPVQTGRKFTEHRDTVADGIGLSILTPVNATPTLEIGFDVLADTTIVLAAQAADIRRDNGKIVGAYIARGELISKGDAKAGFCSIINGEMTIGVADATPMFEQALMSEGYFFRQYPLVVGGQLVENKPKGRAIRKALAELDGRFCIIATREPHTFHDFSQALIDLGVRNAIYLVGSSSSGVYKDENGNRFSIGKAPEKPDENINFIVWR